MNPDENNGFDKQLREKFADFRPEVPTGLWDKIATQLDKQESHHVVPIAGKRRQFPTRWIAVAATLLIVSSITYWYNRPVTVTYLQGQVNPEKTPTQPAVMDTPEQDPVPVPEPLDVERLKRMFAKKNRAVESHGQQRLAEAEEQQEELFETRESQQWATNEFIQPAENAQLVSEPPMIKLEEALAAVPDIKPLIALEEEEETMLASTIQTKQPFGISNILNYVVSTVDQREEKLVTFSNDAEGSLRLDFNFGLAKNKKKLK